MQIDLKFHISELGIATDPTSNYSILADKDGFYIVKEHPVLTITFDNEFNS